MSGVAMLALYCFPLLLSSHREVSKYNDKLGLPVIDFPRYSLFINILKIDLYKEKKLLVISIS